MASSLLGSVAQFGELKANVVLGEVVFFFPPGTVAAAGFFIPIFRIFAGDMVAELTLDGELVAHVFGPDGSVCQVAFT